MLACSYDWFMNNHTCEIVVTIIMTIPPYQYIIIVHTKNYITPLLCM
jgi:hypothetical protein